MAICRSLKFWTLVVLVCILFSGPATAAMSQEEDSETKEMEQESVSEDSVPVTQTHTIQIVRSSFSPPIIEIYQYETVVWRNLNRPKRSFVLVSEDKLWEDYAIPYGRSFAYAFNEMGNFDFSIAGEKGMEGTIVVRAPREVAAEVPLPEIVPQIIPEEEEKIIPKPVEKVTGPEKTVLIVGSAFYPETIELNKGEAINWRNLNRPKRSFMLASEEKLFEDAMLAYGRSFSYTFNEAGTYTFQFADAPGPKLVVTVK